MHETPADFGTGLRAHLGLEQSEPTPLDIAFEKAISALEPEPVAVPTQVPEQTSLDALAVLEAELLERERALDVREASLASRAGCLLAAAQALYDEVLGGGSADHDDELARMRRRKSVA